jgi:hypothetical protein
MKMLQQVEVRSPARRPTCLSSAVRVATLHDFAATLKLYFGDAGYSQLEKAFL